MIRRPVYLHGRRWAPSPDGKRVFVSNVWSQTEEVYAIRMFGPSPFTRGGSLRVRAIRKFMEELGWTP